ncbi:MAG: sulfotransferase [Geminicoccaceae bacterium]|nr:MAG: sulfotransferase [Geminicoccaceae bacterium]
MRSRHPLAGASLTTLARVLAASGAVRRRDAAWVSSYLLSAAARLPFTAADRMSLALTGPREPPADAIFIVGHWRSGTTHLYNLLAQAPRFQVVSPIATGLPGEILTLGRLLRPLLERVLPQDRWIDNVPVGPSAPQEDEFAIASLSDVSFYHALFFPAAFDRHFLPSLFPEGARQARAERAIALFLRKLQAMAPERRVLIKNPAHTARLPRLRALCPAARFVHCVRDPLEVFVSSRRFYERLHAVLALQDAPLPDVATLALDTYQRLMTRYAEDVAALAAPKPVEVRFERLCCEPLIVLEELYAALELDDFAADRPRFVRYLESVADYEQNRYRFDAATVALASDRLGPFFERFGYALPPAA